MGLSSTPVVSVVTPSFNSAAFIRETIESVRCQDYPAVEHIVMDGGSGDGTVDILRRYPDLAWVSEPDRGQAHAINKGFRRARGEIVCWLNSDDTYQVGAIRTAVDYLLQHEDVAAVYGECQIVDEQGKPKGLYATQDFDLRRLLLDDYIPQPAAFMRRGVLESVGFLNEDLHFVFDWEYWLRIGARYSMARLPGAVLANLRVWDDCKSVEHASQFDLEFLRVLDELFQVPPYRDLSPWWKWRAVRLAKSRHHMASAFAAHKAADHAGVADHVPRGVLFNPGWLLNWGVLSMTLEALAGERVARFLRPLAARLVVRGSRQR